MPSLQPAAPGPVAVGSIIATIANDINDRKNLNKKKIKGGFFTYGSRDNRAGNVVEAPALAVCLLAVMVR